ncbi:hypothetical protein B0T19DRAFT_215386 [Cercophora scortea]|uniref:Uncharacterized protein n=1 Tax=Cercophora scortea TaxID=314031 RepID=A0AAE0IFA8_9PEZI|nr:hypothetical protein B0T19DRAFT_215386 [Cercophora scortea]
MYIFGCNFMGCTIPLHSFSFFFFFVFFYFSPLGCGVGGIRHIAYGILFFLFLFFCWFSPARNKSYYNSIMAAVATAVAVPTGRVFISWEGASWVCVLCQSGNQQHESTRWEHHGKGRGDGWRVKRKTKRRKGFKFTKGVPREQEGGGIPYQDRKGHETDRHICIASHRSIARPAR